MKSEFENYAFELSWDVDHFEEMGILDWDKDIEIEKYEGYDSGQIYRVKEFPHPNPIIYKGYKPVVEYIDYPYPDNSWNVMSRRMYEILQSVGNFPHRLIPIAVIDWRIQPWDWFEESTITRENAYMVEPSERYKMGKNLRKEICFGDFVLVQMTEHLDVFDYENSKYTRDEDEPNWLNIDEYAFKIPKGGLPPIFKIPESRTRTFVSAKAREAMRKAKITGIHYLSLKGYKFGEIRDWVDTKIDLPNEAYH